MKRNVLRTGPELKCENYESVQHSLQFSRIKWGKFHRHLNHYDFHAFVIALVYVIIRFLLFSNAHSMPKLNQ